MGCRSSGQNWIARDVIERIECCYLLVSSCLKLSVTLLKYLANISMLVASRGTHMTWFSPVSWPSWQGPLPFLSGCLLEALPVYRPVLWTLQIGKKLVWMVICRIFQTHHGISFFFFSCDNYDLVFCVPGLVGVWSLIPRADGLHHLFIHLKSIYWAFAVCQLLLYALSTFWC